MIKVYRKYLGLSCKEATFLLSNRQETPLTLFEGFKLRWHLYNCTPCRLFEEQIILIGKAFSRLFNESSQETQHFTPEQKAELEKLVHDNLKNN